MLKLFLIVAHFILINDRNLHSKGDRKKSNTEIFCRNRHAKSEVPTNLTKNITVLFNITRCSVVSLYQPRYIPDDKKCQGQIQ